MRYTVRVKPGASEAEVKVDGTHIDVRLKSPPQKGKANTELVKRLSAEFRVPASRVRIVSGIASRDKIVEIT